MNLLDHFGYLFLMQIQARVLDAIKESSPTEFLFQRLFSHYDKRIRPLSTENKPVIVHMSIVLGILIELRENEQVASYVISHTQRWKDPKLSWDPLEYKNITEIIVPQSMIWVPKLFVYNSMDTKSMLDDAKFDARIRYDGLIKLNIPEHVTCICRLSIEQFPFDSQYCAVALASPMLTVEEMDVVSHSPASDSYFAGNSEWLLQNVTVRDIRFLEESEYRAEVHYIFKLKRQPTFYLCVIVAPIFLISALSILGIFTPGTTEGVRSEKVSLGLGSLMATTVLLGIVAGAMPKSNSLPLLGYYILSVILLCAIACGLSIALLTLSKKLTEKGRIPSNLTYKLALVRPRMFSTKRLSCFDRFSIASIKISPNIKGKRVSLIPAHGIVCYRNNKIDENLSDILEFDLEDLAKIHSLINVLVESQIYLKRKIEREQTKLLIQREWSRIFARLDYFNLVFFQGLNMLSLILFMQFAFVPAQPMQDPIV